MGRPPSHRFPHSFPLPVMRRAAAFPKKNRDNSQKENNNEAINHRPITPCMKNVYSQHSLNLVAEVNFVNVNSPSLFFKSANFLFCCPFLTTCLGRPIGPIWQIGNFRSHWQFYADYSDSLQGIPTVYRIFCSFCGAASLTVKNIILGHLSSWLIISIITHKL